MLELARLNDAQVAEMVYGCTGGTDPDAGERVRALPDGVPFLVEEMLASPGVRESFTDGVPARLATLHDNDRRVLVAASAFGRHFDWRLLASSADGGEDAVIDAPPFPGGRRSSQDRSGASGQLQHQHHPRHLLTRRGSQHEAAQRVAGLWVN